MKVLVLGSGAREHALVRFLLADPAVESVVAAPGNAGVGREADVRPVDVLDPDAVVALCRAERPDLVVVGAEAPLVAGAADAVRDAGFDCFGPSRAAAQIEGSKAFAKDVMAAARVPTARAYVCSTVEEAEQALDELGTPYVVKDDGLAAGKGVIVTEDRAVALAHAAACDRVVIEEFLDGPEISLFAISDGATVVALPPAQDFKRVGDGGTGPNTGGMGAYSPLTWLPNGFVDEVMATVVQPTIEELARRGSPFAGCLYVGLALTSRGVRVVEFNARFGDPDSQVVLARLRTPLGGLLQAAATGRLHEVSALDWSDEGVVSVVVATKGYPESPRTGDPVEGIEAAAALDGVSVLHAGTRLDESGAVVSSGGRVLNVLGTGPDVAAARATAYTGVERIRLDGAHWRTDIAAEV